MERFRRMAKRIPSYDRLDNDSGYSEPESRPLTLSEPEEDEEYQGSSGYGDAEGDEDEVERFSWMVYAVFTLLGMAMLWSWYAHVLPQYPSGRNGGDAGTAEY
jgi:hypothetical protein